MPIISKSKYLNGLQCPLLLWVTCNEPASLPAVDERKQAVFDQGHLVGEYAKRLFPTGIEVTLSLGFSHTLSRTQELVSMRRTIFEASFGSSQLYARADILHPVEGDAWDIIEVKSSTSLKPEYLEDILFQKHCFTSAGLKVRNCYLMHINPAYVRSGPIDPQQLFVMKDVTTEVNALLPSLPGKLAAMTRFLSMPKPSVPIGPHCTDPHECPLIEQCWDYLPEHNVTELYYGGKLGFSLLSDGVLSIAAIPASIVLNSKQQIQKETVVSGKMHVEADKVKDWLGKLTYPLAYLDFETFSEAIPRFDGLKPYQQVPFQYSLHIDSGAEMMHKEFLATDPDPRRSFVDALEHDLPRTGSIVAYNASFEIGRLKELAIAFPDKMDWVESVVARVVDLLDVFKSFAVYHPSQHGSCSIKAVLPALCGTSYESLEIGEGATASNEYMRVTFGENIDAADREAVRKNLLAYCKQDTQAMVDLMGKLREFA